MRSRVQAGCFTVQPRVFTCAAFAFSKSSGLHRGFLILAICAASAIATVANGSAKPAQESAAAAGLPPPDTYKIDPVHSFVYFGAWHHVVGLVRGRFENVTGTITVARDPADCAVDVTIATYSVSTQYTERDDDLRSPNFFDAAAFPKMTYRGRGIHRVSEGSWRLDGSLTIRGVTKPVPLTFTFKGLFPDTRAGRPIRAAFHGTAAMKRGDFGMTRDNAAELGVPPRPGNDVEIEIDIEADASALTR